MYNKIRLGIMLIGFTMVILVALSYSGNVSDSCRSEWNFINESDRNEISVGSKFNNQIMTKNKETSIDEKMVREEMNAE